MTAKIKFLGAASAIAMSMAVALPPTVMVSLSSINVAHAAAVTSVEVRGNKRIDAQTIRDNLGVTSGRDFSSSDIDQALKRLFAMGLFSDVTIRQQGSVLVVNIVEYDVINEVSFNGNKRIKNADLERVLSLKPRSPFDRTKLKSDEQTIRQAYASVGRNDVVVKAKIVDLKQGRVNVVFDIKEGARTKVKKIVFEGNNAFGNRRLRDVIVTKRTALLSWLTRDDVYTQDRLEADEEALRLFYVNRGYADFRIVSSSAVLNPATNAYEVVFVLDEGQRYHLGSVTVESTVPGVNTENMRRVLKTRQGDAYNAKKIEDSVLALSDRVADSGYAFAKVEPVSNRDFGSHTISLVYSVDQGPRAYVQRIDIRGNDKTRDYVIRREFDLAEGDAFNQTMIQRAKRRLEDLGFFQSVNISTAPGEQQDQVVLVVDVVERATGEFSVGGGYTSGGETPGASVEASVTERNLLGRGQYVRLGATMGQSSAKTYSFSITEPYFLGYRLSAGIDLFHRSYRMNDDYDVSQTGGTVRFGIPITDKLTASFGYNYNEETYKLNDSWFKEKYGAAAEQMLYNVYSGAIVEASKYSPWRRSSVSYGLTYNAIDDLKNPHDGLFLQVSQEYAGLGGDADYLKTTGKTMLYKTISERYDVVGFVSGGAGYIHQNGKDGVRIFDMFKNNSDMIRGFKFNGIGPVQYSASGDKYFLGGNTYMNASAEVQFPIPVVPDSFGMRGALFADAATLYGNNYTPSHSFEGDVTNTSSSLRSSAGVSLMWNSPFGPLRFDYAWPIHKEKEDRVQNFNFGVSTKF